MVSRERHLAQSHLRDSIEAKLEPIIERSLRRSITKVLAANDLGTFANLHADDALTAALLPDRFGLLLSSWQHEVETSLTGALLAAWRTAAAAIMGTLPDGLEPVIGPNVRDVRAARFFGTIRNRLIGVGDNAYQDVVAALRTTLESGGSPEKAADAVRRELGVSYRRSRVIARTETGAALGDANNSIAEELAEHDIVSERIWLATIDQCGPGGRTRPTHCEAHMQRRPPGVPFLVGGYALMFPCDPDGPAQEVIQCRCDVLLDVTS